MDAQKFWRGIWSETKGHHKDVQWLKDVKKELDQDEYQDKIDMTKDKMMRVLRKMPDCKAPAPENAQDCWLKNSTLLYDKLLVYLKDLLDSWLVSKRMNSAYTKG